MINPNPGAHRDSGLEPGSRTAAALGPSLAAAASSPVQRPEIWRATDRHLLLGVSHPSDDPTRHRTFEIRASFLAASNGWIARVAEQNVNDQRGDWEIAASNGELALVYPTAAACLGHAVTHVLETVDREADEHL